jgi:amino acid adenylation domain-containing protein
MKIVELINWCLERNISFSLDGDNIRILGDAKALTQDAISKIKESKPELIEWLKEQATQATSSVKIKRREREYNSLPLSLTQQRLWLICQLNDDTSQYNIPVVIRLHGELNHKALQKSFNTILQRHEILRTTYHEVNGEAVQRISSEDILPINLIDISQVDALRQEDEMVKLVKAEVAKPFVLTKDLMIRVTLIKLSDLSHVLTFTIHHISSDGWSMGILSGEFIRNYSAFDKGINPDLPALEIQYGDFSIWQRENFDESKLEKQIAYWTQELEDIPAVHQLPLDHKRSKEGVFTGACVSHKIAKEKSSQLEKLAKKHDSTLYMVLHSLFSLLLSRYSGQSDIVVGSPIAGRSTKQLDSLIGFFVNNVVIRSKLDENQTFAQSLVQNKATILNAFTNQDLPFEVLLEHLPVDRSQHYSPVFQICFNLQTANEQSLSLPNLDIEYVQVGINKVRYELELLVFELDDGLILSWTYADTLFERSSIQSLADSFVTLVDEILQHPEKVLADLAYTPQTQLKQLESWNDTKQVFDDNICVHELIEKQCRLTPDAIAVSYEHLTLSYQQLNAKANCLANYLIEEGVEVGDKIGLFQSRSIEMVISVLAVMKVGAAYVPLDTKLPQGRLDYMIQDARIEHLILHSADLEKISIAQVDITLIDDALQPEWLAEYGGEYRDELSSPLTADNLIYVIYTSGSTGKPKGVMINHRGVVNYLHHASREYLGDDYRGAVMSSPLSFDATVTTLFTPLLSGKELVILPEDQDKLVGGLQHYLFESPNSWLFKLTPAHLSLLESTVLGSSNIEHTIVVGGEQLTVNTLYPYKATYLPNSIFVNEYGPTETVVGCSVFSVKKMLDLEKCDHIISIGKPIQNTGLYVLNNHKTVPVGVVGELHISGAGLAPGYLAKPELTGQQFITHTFENGEVRRLYKTGDLVRYLPDGNLLFVGRIDDQVKLRGFRIELGEIENLLNSYSGVKEALVLVIGKGDEQKLAAYISAENSTQLDLLKKALVVDIPAYLRRHLPEYMIPAMFFSLEALPLTLNGKVDKKALPTHRDTSAASTFVAPETDTEKCLAHLWMSLLKLDKVGKQTDFFKVGGHSLLAMRFISLLAKEHDIVISLNTLFEQSVLVDLAEFIDQQVHTSVTHIEAVDKSLPIPLSYPQRRLWFIDKLGRGSPQYNIPIAIRLKGRLDKEYFTLALQTIIDRHDILRTAYQESIDGPVQVIAATADFDVKFIDLNHLSGSTDVQEKKLQSLISEEAARPFDLNVDLMLRVSLVELAEEDSVIQFTMHHIASDGWSLGILVNEFVALYSAFRNGQASPLPPLSIQYADFAYWQRNSFSEQHLVSQLEYWQQNLDGMPQVHGLALDKTRPAKQEFAGGSYEYVIDTHLVKQLNKVATNNGATLFMLLQSAFALILGRWSNEKDIMIGSPIAGRGHPDLEPLIGFFVNTLVLRTKLDATLSFEQLLQQNKQMILGAFRNQDVPFETLVDSLKLDRSLSHSPIFQIMFTMQNNDTVNMSLPGLTIEGLSGGQANSKFDLDLMVTEQDGKLFVNWTYAKSLFDHETITSLGNSFQVLLQQVAISPGTLCYQLPLTNAEQEKKYRLASATVASDINFDCPTQWFEQQVNDTPDNTALVSGDVTLSYSELNRRANQLAYVIIAKGIKPGDIIGLCMGRSIEMVIAVLGAMKAGATYLPLDPRLPQERLNYLVMDSQVSLVLLEDKLLSHHSFSGCEQLLLSADKVFENYPVTNPELTQVNGNDLCYIIYTSGSTGKPKGVMVPHSGVVNYLAHAVENYLTENIVGAVLSSPLSFDATVTTLLAPLVSGRKLVILPEAQNEVITGLIAYFNAEEDYLFKITPAHLDLLSSSKISGSARHMVVIGGEQLTVNCLLPWKKTLLPNSIFVNEYGPTETVVGCMNYWVHELQDVLSERNVIPIGLPIQNTQLYVLNNQQPLPAGAIGELHIGGHGVTNGYLNRDDLTTEKFIPNPLNPRQDDIIYRTGDLVRFCQNGQLEYIGRIDDQLKIRGYRVEAGEIEAKLVAHNKVKEAVVVANGEGSGKHLVAYYVAYQEQPTIAELKLWLKTSLAEYMVPEKYVVVDEFVLTSNGKIDKKALPRVLESQINDSHFIAPRYDIEQQLTDIWCEILTLDKVSINENFFEIGGNSLLSLEVQKLVAERTSYEIELTDVFEYPTINGLANYLSREEDVEERTLTVNPNDYHDRRDIAVIGMSGRFPGAANIDEFWQNICSGEESIQFFDDKELLEAGVDLSILRNPNYVKSGYLLKDLEKFDAKYFSFTPREAELLDPQHRFMLECASDALEHAGYGDQSTFRNVGVYVGVADSMYMLENLMPNPEIIRTAGISAHHSNSSGFISTRLSYKLNLTGPSVNVLTACSTSLVAVHQACNSLLMNECEMALAGGAGISQLKPKGYFFEEGGIVSPDGHCRPFDDNARGTRAGNGAAVLLLKRLDRALEDKDTIHAVIKGSAVNNDAAEKVGYAAPSVGGQADVIRKALLKADVSSTSIQYVEAHGTGTKIGDPIEFKALKNAYATSQKGFCALGTVKANIGHLDNAAGAAGLIKVIEAIKHKQIPPSINFNESNSQINFDDSPFYINTESKDWYNENETRRAGVSSFGIGGTNAHVIVEQAPVVGTSSSVRDTWLLPISAKSKTALNQAWDNLCSFLQKNDSVSLHDVAYTLQVGRSRHEYTTALSCKSREEAISILQQKPKVIANKETRRSVIFMFPGQGAQYINMAQQLYQTESVFKKEFDLCADTLVSMIGVDLRDIIYPEINGEVTLEDAKGQINQTGITQPALFSIEYCLAKLLRSWGIEPEAMIGHSIGEYVAACLAGVFELEDALKLVSVRGRLMQQVAKGSMLSTSMAVEELRPLLEQSNTCLAGVNSQSNCVASGTDTELAHLMTLLDEKNEPYRTLHTSHAFHSKMMDVILDDFKKVVDNVSLNAPTIRYISNVTGDYITAEQAQDPQYWVDHLRGTVLFADGVETILADTSTLSSSKVLIEVGPGISLSTMARKNARASDQAIVSTIRHPNEVICDVNYLLNSLGKLWGYGIIINWQDFHQGDVGRRIPLPTYPYEKVRYWIDSPKASGLRPVNTLTKMPIDQWWYVPTWKQKPVIKKDKLLKNLSTSSWLIIMDEKGIGEALAKCLLQAEQQVNIAYHGECFTRISDNEYTLNLSQEADYLALLRATDAITPLTRVIHLASISPMYKNHDYDLEVFWSEQENGALSALYTIKAIVKAGLSADLKVDFVTNDIARISGEEIVHPGKATITSLCKVAPQEYPELVCNHIDVKLHSYHDSEYVLGLGISIYNELVVLHRCSNIALRGNQRWENQYEGNVIEPDMPAAQTLKDGGVYVITGGLGNIGLLLAGYISKTVKNAKLVLLGRSIFPETEDWDYILKEQADETICKKISHIRELQSRGADVAVMNADIGDLAQMQSVFTQVENQFGAINGVIHCAGQVHGSMKALIETTKQDFELQYRSKVDGVLVLEKLLSTRQPDFCLLMSSLSSVLGGLGFSAYAAANIFMDAFVQRKHDLGDDSWISVNWDGWDFTSVDDVNYNNNNFALTPEEGELAFAKVLSAAYYPQLINSTGLLEHRMNQWIEKTETVTLNLYARPELDTDYVQPSNEVEEQLASIWQEVLGIEKIGIQDHFFDIGGDSLVATRVISAIRQKFSVSESVFSIRDFFEKPVIEHIAAKITAGRGNSQVEDAKAQLLDAGKVVEEGVF